MKRSLQCIVLVLSLLPFSVGMLGLLRGVEFYIPLAAANPNLDSQFRFMSAWDIGLAAIIWWIVPQIGRQTALFRIVSLAVFLGGVGRLAAWHFSGRPATVVLVVAAIELLVPLLIPWQAHVARVEAGETRTA